MRLNVTRRARFAGRRSSSNRRQQSSQRPELSRLGSAPVSGVCFGVSPKRTFPCPNFLLVTRHSSHVTCPMNPRPPRRPRYRGKNPRRFEEKYKEHDPQRYGETIAKVLASGKTPAGTHRPVMVQEILEVLAPEPGAIAVDCTLGYGGHAQEILARITPGGRLLGLDADPIELPKTEARLRSLGYGPEQFSAHRSNYAGLPQVLAKAGLTGADLILADLGVSSMQIDDPSRGFSTKFDGSLDMRMNPARGQSACSFLQGIDAAKLVRLLEENSDEP